MNTTIGGEVTTAPVAASSAPLRPEFVRVPREGSYCPFTGLSRTAISRLILPAEANGYNPPVRSVCLRQKGRIRGIRLVDYASLIGYLNAQDQGNFSSETSD